MPSPSSWPGPPEDVTAPPRVGATAVMVVHDDETGALTRFLRDLQPSLWLLRPVLDTELVVIDNSSRRLDRLSDAVLSNGAIPARYIWNRGENLLYGPSLNQAARLAHRPYLLYACASHGRSFDPTWAWDLLQPLLEDASGLVAMAGSLQASGSPAVLGFPAWLPPLHVQGGLFAARTAVIAAHPYPGGDYAHWGSDVYQSFQLLQKGYRLADVPTVRSVWRAEVGGGTWKYVHAGG